MIKKSSRLVLFTVILAVTAAPAALASSAKAKKKPHVAPAPNKVDELIKTYDKDHDGKFDKQEMKVFLAAADANAGLAFDQDHDGILSSEEVDAWRQAAAKAPAKAPAKSATKGKSKGK